MASSLIENLGSEIDRIAAIYESSFAGQSRATRDLDELQGLIRRVQAVVSQIDQIPSAAQGPDLTRLRQVAVTNLGIYESEMGAIAQAKSAGPEFEEFARLAASANFIFGRYFRHFAGKDRASRDLGLLAEMAEDLKGLRSRMSAVTSRSASPGFAKDVELVGNTLELYQRELREIESARKSGSAEQQASLMAALANSQFQLYRVHFAGQSRVTRRPALLMRVIDNLRRVRDTMQSLKEGGLAIDYNDKNIAIVEDNLHLYEKELAEIRTAKQGTKLDDLMGELGGAANALFDQYREAFAGKDRSQVSLENLGNICDKLGEIARQMLDLSRVESVAMNEQNIEIVLSQLTGFEREYEAVHRAQQGGS